MTQVKTKSKWVLLILLGILMWFAMPQQGVSAADSYIADINVVDAYYKSDFEDIQETNYSDWTFYDEDLNDGCGGYSDYIYLFSKSTTNSSEAITDILLLYGRSYKRVRNITINNIQYTACGGYYRNKSGDDNTSGPFNLNNNNRVDNSIPVYIFITHDSAAGNPITTMSLDDEYVTNAYNAVNQNGFAQNINENDELYLHYDRDETRYLSNIGLSIGGYEAANFGIDYAEIYGNLAYYLGKKSENESYTAEEYAQISPYGSQCWVYNEKDINDSSGGGDWCHMYFQYSTDPSSYITDIRITKKDYGATTEFSGCTYTRLGGVQYDNDAEESGFVDSINIKSNCDGDLNETSLYVYITRDSNAGQPICNATIGGILDDVHIVLNEDSVYQPLKKIFGWYLVYDRNEEYYITDLMIFGNNNPAKTNGGNAIKDSSYVTTYGSYDGIMRYGAAGWDYCDHLLNNGGTDNYTTYLAYQNNRYCGNSVNPITDIKVLPCTEYDADIDTVTLNNVTYERINGLVFDYITQDDSKKYYNTKDIVSTCNINEGVSGNPKYIFISRDPSLGNPITKVTVDENQSVDGMETATNQNGEIQATSVDGNIYIHFQRSVTATNSGTGTILSNGNIIWICILGAVIVAIAVVLIVRKRKQQQA